MVHAETVAAFWFDTSDGWHDVWRSAPYISTDKVLSKDRHGKFRKIGFFDPVFFIRRMDNV